MQSPESKVARIKDAIIPAQSVVAKDAITLTELRAKRPTEITVVSSDVMIAVTDVLLSPLYDVKKIV